MVDDGKIPTILISGLLTLRAINVRIFIGFISPNRFWTICQPDQTNESHRNSFAFDV
jgi:hypothetical protein